MKRKFALIPAYKPNENLIYFVQSIEARGIEVVVVNDGSGGCEKTRLSFFTSPFLHLLCIVD